MQLRTLKTHMGEKRCIVGSTYASNVEFPLLGRRLYDVRKKRRVSRGTFPQLLSFNSERKVADDGIL